jgi:hypothetical protein
MKGYPSEYEREAGLSVSFSITPKKERPPPKSPDDIARAETRKMQPKAQNKSVSRLTGLRKELEKKVFFGADMGQAPPESHPLLLMHGMAEETRPAKEATSNTSLEEDKIARKYNTVREAPHAEPEDTNSSGFLGSSFLASPELETQMENKSTDLLDRSLDTSRASEGYAMIGRKYGVEPRINTQDEAELDAMRRRLEARLMCIQDFIREIECEDCDMLLYRNKLTKEVCNIESDLKEASNNILVLMDDRKKAKKSFFLLRVRLKQLKDLNVEMSKEINK